MTDVGEHYRRSRERLTELLGEIDEAGWERPVAACPGWDVHDVVAHLVGVAEDALDGTLTGPPTEAQSTAEVERRRGVPPPEMLSQWADVAGPFEELITSLTVWPPAMDVHCHEHDIRTALERPGARDDPMIRISARMLIERLDVPATITFDFGDEAVQSPPKSPPAPNLLVRTTAFEAFRLRLGRRTRGQVAALDWSEDPGEVIDGLFLFGPAEAPLVE